MKELSEGRYIWQSVRKPIFMVLIAFAVLIAVCFDFSLNRQEIADGKELTPRKKTTG